MKTPLDIEKLDMGVVQGITFLLTVRGHIRKCPNLVNKMWPYQTSCAVASLSAKFFPF